MQTDAASLFSARAHVHRPLGSAGVADVPVPVPVAVAVAVNAGDRDRSALPSAALAAAHGKGMPEMPGPSWDY